MGYILLVANISVLIGISYLIYSFSQRVSAIESAVISSVLEDFSRPISNQAKIRKHINAIVIMALVPSVMLLVLGVVWKFIPTAMAVMCVIVIAIISVAIIAIGSLILD